MLKERFPFLPLLMAVVMTAQLSCARRTSTEDASASRKPSEQAEIDRILQRYEEAVGGKDAIAGIKSYRMKGTFELPGVTGKMEAWRKEPNKTLSVIEFPRIGKLTRGFDGETRWVQTPAGTFTDSNPQQIVELERDTEAYSVAKIRTQFESLKLETKARLSGRDVYVIEGKPAKGPAEKLFFDVENGLLLRWDMARRQQERRTVFVKMHLDDYKEVGGVKVPFKFRLAFEQFNLIMKLDEVEHNVAIDDGMFKKP